MQRIFLTGLSGSGKSTAGREVARLLGWRFIDLDDLLSEHLGLPVGRILVEYGEERFRQLESKMLRVAAEQERVVIATGGGAVIGEANRTLMRELGLSIYLQVPIELAWQRVQEQIHLLGTPALRPLLAGDGLQHLRDLFTRRKQWYEQANVSINAGEHPPTVVACQIVAFALAHGYLSSPSLEVVGPQRSEAKRVSNPSQPAPIDRTEAVLSLQLGSVSSQAIISWGALHNLPEALQSLALSRRVFIITDTEVGWLYGEPVQTLLERAAFVPHVFSVPSGESSKSFLCLQQIIDWLVEHKAERQEAIVALGGGVIGDLAGFAASCYQRGVPLIQVPTTLLAQVDAAIGGKTGINHPRGKNLVGSFYQPRLILVDPAVLLTLPARVYREGWAEIVKYAMILDPDLFAMLEEHADSLRAPRAPQLPAIIARCIRLKMDVVQRDERDAGLRNILNYGHTFGHALEALTDYGTWLHGEAVALGMEVAARIAVAKGLISHEDALRQHHLLHALDLPVHCSSVDIEAILSAMSRDKKVQAGEMRWVLPTHIGYASVYDAIPLEIVRKAIEAVCSLQEAS